MAVTTTTFDSLLSGLSSEATNSVEIIMRNTSTGVSKKMSFATFAALLYAWITSNKASDLASVLGVLSVGHGGNIGTTDADSLEHLSFCAHTTGSANNNFPCAYCFVLTYILQGTNTIRSYGSQIAFGFKSNGSYDGIYYRHLLNSSWKDWITINTTS